MVKQLLCFLGLMLPSSCLLAQASDSIGVTIQLKDVVVSSFKPEPVQESTLTITPIYMDSVAVKGAYNLTSALAQTPGVSMLSTGIAIAKPVIRGLYGNRVLVLLSGLKFDNQQWQEEHGLGMSEIGLSKVELIKGPMGVLYGSEAMGGVINIIEEDQAASGESEQDLAAKFNSNTLGGTLQAGWKKNSGKRWSSIRLGVENNGDYSDGNNTRVLNSRFDGYYLKIGYGFTRKNWTSINHFSSSFNRFGFIFKDSYTFVSPDARWSRKMSENPAHLVALNVFSSENKIRFSDRSQLTALIGVQSNERMENEGGGAISLNMHLFSIQYLLKWERQLDANHRFILANLGSFEDNTNYGARKIVPDARMQESNVAAYFESNWGHRIILENGFGVGEKVVKTFFTSTVNGQGKEIQPFYKHAPYYNLFSGFSILPSEKWTIKGNIATGVRIPNLAELSSDGLHEGVFTYEIGNPNLKNEQNLCLNASIDYHNRLFEYSFTPFYNYFLNYVYLSPTTEEWYGFPIYRYRQQDAKQYGGELYGAVRLPEQLKLALSYATLFSETADGQALPFTPPQKIRYSLVRDWGTADKKYNAYVNVDQYAAQDRVYSGELKTAAYALLNAGFSYTCTKGDKRYEWAINGNNLLNKAYYDHLSRMKYYGLLNPGRNIVLVFRMNLKPSRTR